MKIIASFIVCIVFVGCSPSPRYTVHTPSAGQPSTKTGGAGSGTVTYNGKEFPVATSDVDEEARRKLKGKVFRGLASYYADDFHGRKTANGEKFNMHGLTCAHKTLPFNLWLEVTNLANNRTVVVRVNDRGPFVGNRILDLSLGAAEELHMIEAGVQEVEIKVIK
ncbi:septal ring lytic transglycosylase RlpA family protein [Candidatus Latescibacterota bacterium]